MAWSLSNADGVSFVLNCTLFHSRSKALVESAMSALISFVLVNEAVAGVATGVPFTFSDGPSKEAFAAVAGSRSVVFSRGSVTANGAK